MPRRIEKRERGVYEKEPGSDIWWIRQKVDGTFHRKKVGYRGDAIKLYKVRRTDRDGGTISAGIAYASAA